MYICIYVYMYICIYVCMYVCIYVYTRPIVQCTKDSPIMHCPTRRGLRPLGECGCKVGCPVVSNKRGPAASECTVTPAHHPREFQVHHRREPSGDFGERGVPQGHKEPRRRRMDHRRHGRAYLCDPSNSFTLPPTGPLTPIPCCTFNTTDRL